MFGVVDLRSPLETETRELRRAVANRLSTRTTGYILVGIKGKSLEILYIEASMQANTRVGNCFVHGTSKMVDESTDSSSMMSIDECLC